MHWQLKEKQVENKIIVTQSISIHWLNYCKRQYLLLTACSNVARSIITISGTRYNNYKHRMASLANIGALDTP